MNNVELFQDYTKSNIWLMLSAKENKTIKKRKIVTVTAGLTKSNPNKIINCFYTTLLTFFSDKTTCLYMFCSY